MEIFVREFHGHTFSVHLRPRDTIRRLKDQVEDQRGIPVYRQLLMFGAIPLEDDCLPSHYRVHDQSELDLFCVPCETRERAQWWEQRPCIFSVIRADEIRVGHDQMLLAMEHYMEHFWEVLDLEPVLFAAANQLALSFWQHEDEAFRRAAMVWRESTSLLMCTWKKCMGYALPRRGRGRLFRLRSDVVPYADLKPEHDQDAGLDEWWTIGQS